MALVGPSACAPKFLAELPESGRPLVASKFGHVVNAAGERVTGASRSDIIADCEASLKNLDTDCIDLFQLHWPAPQPMEETAQELRRAVAGW